MCCFSIYIASFHTQQHPAYESYAITLNNGDDHSNANISTPANKYDTTTATSTEKQQPEAKSSITNGTINSSTSSSTSTAMTSFAGCMLQLQEHFKSIVPPIARALHPLPFSVKIVNNQYYVLLTLHTAKDQAKWWQDHRYLNSFACNDIDGATPLPFVSKTQNLLMIKCPQSLKGADEVLKTFSIKPHWKDTIVYNVEKFSECEQKDIAAYADRTGSRSIKTGITATFSGQRDNALEWAIYHHLLGFDHIWIYVNEPWDDGKDLHSADFLTFIPYNNHAKDIYVGANVSTAGMLTQWMEVFRDASQNDALYRASRMGLEWMAFIDLDEVVVLGPGAAGSGVGVHSKDVTGTLTNSTETESSAPPPLLHTYLADFKAAHSDGYGAMFLQSVPFGKNIQETETELELQIDYTWREKGINMSTKDCCKSRNKLLINVRKAASVNIHYFATIGGDGTKTYFPTADELRVNHYKKKEQGVFNMKRSWLGPPNVIEDTGVRDEYRDLIVQQMVSIREGKVAAFV